jgi:hypothetical protein
MAVTAKLYGLLAKSLINGEVDFTNDTIKVMLCTSSYTPNQDTHQYKSSVDNEVEGTGYTAGGATLGTKAITYDADNNKVLIDAADTSWATSTITARYAVIYDDTPETNKPLIGYIDFGENIITNAGEFKITWDAAGIFSFSVT